MNLLYIVNVWPEPQTSGASSRVLQLIQCLQMANFTITVASTANKTEKSAIFDNETIQTVTIQLNDESFDTFIKKENPNLVIFDRFLSEEKFGWRVAENCPSALRVLDTIDLHTLRDARAEQCKNSEQPLNLHNDTSLREIASIFRCDLTLFVGDYELALVEKNFNVPSQLLYYHPFTTTSSIHTSPQRTFEERIDFISIGSFLHSPNWDAVLQLKQHIWPLIKKKLPTANIHIFGSYTPDKAKKLHNEKQGFLVKGFVDNDFEAMQKARVHLAPLRFGAGIKSKCVLAFEALTPSVTTSIGAEGLTPTTDWAGTICDDAAAFANSAVNLYQDKEQFIKAQNQCKTIIEHYNNKHWDYKLLEKLRSFKEGLWRHREKNYIGKMMLHHHHLSTRYMSKWIEEKHKKSVTTQLLTTMSDRSPE